MFSHFSRQFLNNHRSREIAKVDKPMGYLAVWKVLEQMVTDLRKRGVTVPVEIISDLKIAKTAIRILKADPSCGENAPMVEQYLERVESYLVSEGQRRFGQSYVDEWLEQRDQAARRVADDDDEKEEESRFISGLPREQGWIRLTPSAELPVEQLKTLVNESNLSYKMQSNGCVIIFGPDAILKDFVRRIASKNKPRAEKGSTGVHNC